MELTRFKTTIKTLPARFGKALYVLFEMFCEVIGNSCVLCSRQFAFEGVLQVAGKMQT